MTDHDLAATIARETAASVAPRSLGKLEAILHYPQLQGSAGVLRQKWFHFIIRYVAYVNITLRAVTLFLENRGEEHNTSKRASVTLSVTRELRSSQGFRGKERLLAV